MSLKSIYQIRSGRNVARSLLTGLALYLACAASALADSTLTYVSVTSQRPATISPGQSATYTVTANRVGIGSFDAYCTVSGLPAGTAVSFAPAVIVFEGKGTAKSVVMTISTSTNTLPGIYPFTITCQHGNGSKTVKCTGILAIGSGAVVDLPQRILAIDGQAEDSMLLTCSGEGLHPYVVQVALTLEGGNWTNLATVSTDANGIFTYLDTGATNCTCRFYRTSTP